MVLCVRFRTIYVYMDETETGATAQKLARNANIPSPFAVSSRTVATFMCRRLRADMYARRTGIVILHSVAPNCFSCKSSVMPPFVV